MPNNICFITPRYRRAVARSTGCPHNPSMSDDPYAADAAFYDAIHGDFREDTGLWLSFAGRTDQPVLEVGCGTGRIALELARNGHEVTGIDPSAAMLAIARAKAEADALEVSFIEGRATELALQREGYGLVLIPLDVFLYCQDGEEQSSLLRTLGETLVFNGALAIDLPGPASGLDPDTNGQQMLVFSGETEDGRVFDAIVFGERQLGVAAIDAGTAGIDQVLDPSRAAAFEHVDEPDQVGLRVGVRMRHRVAHAGLRGEVDDAREAAAREQVLHGADVGDVHTLESEAALTLQLRQARVFQRRVVVVV